MGKNKGESLLVIRLSALGDVAMTVPVLLSLTRNHPALKLLILTRPFFAPIFKDLPNTEVFTADFKEEYKGFPGIYRLSKELKKISLAGIADLHNVLRTKVIKFFFSGSGLTFVQIDKGRKEKKHLTRWRSKELSPLRSTHERYADVFRKMGFEISLSPQDVFGPRPMDKAVETFAAPEGKKLIGVAPFAAFEGKMYPMNLMEKVLEALNKTNKYKIILFGGGAEEVRVLKELDTKYTHCSSAAGRFSFDQELDLISNLDLMVSMDSGNGHLAAMFGVRTLTLWGITHPFAGFVPYGQPLTDSIMADRDKYPLIPTSVYGNKYPKGYENVMETIHPDLVVQKIEALTHI